MRLPGARCVCGGCGALQAYLVIVVDLPCTACGARQWRSVWGLVWAVTDIVAWALLQASFLVEGSGERLGAEAFHHQRLAWLVCGGVALTLADRWGWL